MNVKPPWLSVIILVEWCMLKPVEIRVESAWFIGAFEAKI